MRRGGGRMPPDLGRPLQRTNLETTATMNGSAWRPLEVLSSGAERFNPGVTEAW